MIRAGKIAPEQLPILFVKNLNYEVSSDALWKLFDPGEDGLIRQIRQGISVEAKGTAYVVFWNVMDAKNALEKLNGYNFQNRYLVVLWHQPEKTLRSKDDLQARKDNLAQLKMKHVPSSPASTKTSSTATTASTMSIKKDPISVAKVKKGKTDDVAGHARKVALNFVRGLLPQKSNKLCMT
ncbi:hypothetical protein GGR53DRAFT_462531 [Hypoxylon sp. FL1150]|nr:hypothetical protein GGR53DRAFT_462531 [Hypoxylon sp. FL1150]